MAARRKRVLDVIGWREWVALPSFEIEHIKAKIDTGAQTSALHAVRIKPFMRDGSEWVSFDVHPFPRNSRATVNCEAPVVDHAKVRSSNGKLEVRPRVLSSLHLGDVDFVIELTLTNRSLMGFPLLIGREALRKRYVVDVSRSFVYGKPAFAQSARRKSSL